MPSGRGLTVWLLVAVVLWTACGCVIGNVNGTSSAHVPQHQPFVASHHNGNSLETYNQFPKQDHYNILKESIKIPHYISDNSIQRRKLSSQVIRRRSVGSRFKRDYLKQKRRALISLVNAALPHRVSTYQRRSPYTASRLADNHQNYVIDNDVLSQLQNSQPHISNTYPNEAFEAAFGPWLKKRSGPRENEPDSNNVNSGPGDIQNEIKEEKEEEKSSKESDENRGQEEINKSLQQVGSSMNRAFFRSTRNGPRPWDVPQIVCPAAEDMERFPCPSPDRMGRYRCIDEHLLCDGFIDCPLGEDEDREQCMFYKMTKAHLDILADAIIRWARGGK